VAEKQQALAKLQATEAELASLLSPRPSSGRAASQARLELQEARQQAEELGLATEAVAREGAACAKELARRGKVRVRVRVGLTLTPNLTPTLTLTPTPTPNRT